MIILFPRKTEFNQGNLLNNCFKLFELKIILELVTAGLLKRYDIVFKIGRRKLYLPPPPPKRRKDPVLDDGAAILFEYGLTVTKPEYI